MKDFWAFRTMVTPIIIQVIFWIGTAVCIIAGLFLIFAGIEYGAPKYSIKGLALLILGPLGVRIYCEIMVVFFRINETLTEIKHAIEDRSQPPKVESAGG